MRGEHDAGIGMLRGSRANIEARPLDPHFPRLIADPAELAKEIICYGSFVAGDRFDVHQLAGERDSIHGGENSRARCVGPRAVSFELPVLRHPERSPFSGGRRDPARG